MDNFLLGIDIGSGACKVTLLKLRNKKALTLSKEYPTYYPKAGWAEQDSKDWIESTGSLIREILLKSNCSPDEIIAVGVCGVTHSPVLLDSSNNVLGRVIHITDARSKRESDWLEKKAGDFILNTGLNSASVMWTISMLLWIKNNEPDRWEKISKIIFPKDYIRFKLSGSLLTDEVDAQGTLFFNPVKKRWVHELTKIIGLNSSILPDVVKPSEVVGKITSYGARWSGLKEGTTVIAGTTDTLMEVFASGSISPGDCTVKLATFGRICVITDKPYFGKGLINYSYIKDGLWYPGTGTKSFAASLRWFRDEFCKDIRKNSNVFKAMDKEAETVSAGSDGLLFHPYLQGEGSPYDNPDLKGNFIGLSLYHRRANLIRAILEGTSFSLLDCIEFIKDKGIKINQPYKFIGGGTKSNLWIQILADIFGSDAYLPSATDPSIGAAILSGIGVGVYSSFDQAQKENFKISKKIIHDKNKNSFYKEIFRTYKSAKQALENINNSLLVCR